MPHKKQNEENGEKKIKSISRRYPMIKKYAISNDYATIPDVVEKIVYNRLPPDAIKSKEFELFPIRKVEKGFFKTIQGKNLKRGMPTTLHRKYINDVEIEVLRAAYKLNLIVRESLKEIIDHEALDFFVYYNDNEIKKIDNKHFLLRRINSILSSGLIKPVGYKNKDNYEILLVEKKKFQNWARRLKPARSQKFLKTILEEINKIEVNDQIKIKQDDLRDIVVNNCAPHHNISEDEVDKVIWPYISDDLKIKHRPRKNDTRYEMGRQWLLQIMSAEAILKK